MSENEKNRTDDLTDLKLYTLKEIAPILGVTYRTVVNYVQKGKLPAKKIGGKWKVSGEMIRAWIDGAESNIKDTQSGTDTEESES